MSVYFIQAGEGGPIKIGHSKDPWRRLHNHQLSNPERCEIIGLLEGGAPEEQALHFRFRADRFKGEWFKPSPEILQFAAEHKPSRRARPHRARLARAPADPAEITVDTLMDALGGTKAASVIFGTYPQVISNWRASNRMPTRLWVAMTEEFNKRGIEAPFRLWRIQPPREYAQ